MSDSTEADDPVATALAYHERTHHAPHRFAASLGYMDWATQPNPFRRYDGAPEVPLPLVPVDNSPRYEPCFVAASLPVARRLDADFVGQLFQDALGLSAWKEAGGGRWALRMNPSSGNLHPTEGYLIAGPIAQLTDAPGVFHYAPHDHLLERRAQLSAGAWSQLSSLLPDSAVLVGLTSILWREAWKYGERAFRYCQHDVGHAIAGVAVAAAALGWEARLLEDVVDADLALLLGVHTQSGVEAEHPDCLMVLVPAPRTVEDRARLDAACNFKIPAPVLVELLGASFHGTPNALSPSHEDWQVIENVSRATEKREPPAPDFHQPSRFENADLSVGDSSLSLRRVVHQRRSAVSFDGHTGIARSAFYQMLLKTLPGRLQLPFSSLPWHPAIDLLLYVHRVADVPPGLYALLRDPERETALRLTLDPGFVWTRPECAPPSLPLFLLEAGDARKVAAQCACGQEIAADGVFAVAMLADFDRPITTHGAWFYRRLHWEAGAVGQVLYLEAEASGIRGTGIGCFFDDLGLRTFGITSERRHGRRILYHFTVGGPVEDTRIATLPPYAHLAR